MSIATGELTLWDLAQAVCAEVDEVVGEKEEGQGICNAVLHHLIATRVANIEVMTNLNNTH